MSSQYGYLNMQFADGVVHSSYTFLLLMINGYLIMADSKFEVYPGYLESGLSFVFDVLFVAFVIGDPLVIH